MRKNPDPDYPLTPPVGRSGRAIGGGAGYSIAGVNEFDELIDDIYHFSESQGLEIDTLIHEEGAGQLEINLRHGDPIELADQVFMFKRTIREAALKHDIYATFMAKPIQGQPGSAMHIHQSIIDKKTGRNIFTDEDGGRPSVLPLHRRHAEACAERAGDVRALRELLPPADAGGVGAGQQQMGLRQPHHGLPRSALRPGGAARRKPHPLFRRQSLSGAGRLARLRADRHDQQDRARRAGRDHAPTRTRSICRAGCSKPSTCSRTTRSCARCSAASFVATYAAIKRAEFETFMEVISPWEREYLLLNV